MAGVVVVPRLRLRVKRTSFNVEQYFARHVRCLLGWSPATITSQTESAKYSGAAAGPAASLAKDRDVRYGSPRSLHFVLAVLRKGIP
jgi:hypothetical protein